MIGKVILFIFVVWLCIAYADFISSVSILKPILDGLRTLRDEKFFPFVDYILGDYSNDVYKWSGLAKYDNVYTADDLLQFDGVKTSTISLAILGEIFNVTKGVKHYGQGGGYNGFAGRDATRAFVSGDFTKAGLVDDITGLEDKDFLALADWANYYHKSYPFQGYLVGRFYDSKGQPTAELKEFRARVQIAKKEQEAFEKTRREFPDCNLEWNNYLGTKVWCTRKSGGVKRDWVGFPRQFFSSPDEKDPRCVCVDSLRLSDKRLRAYSGCRKNSVECTVQEAKEEDDETD